MKMDRETILVLVIFVLSIGRTAKSCHASVDLEEEGELEGLRKRRNVESEGEVRQTKFLRDYFTACMEAMIPSGESPQFAWRTNVDFTVLDSQWFANTAQVYCSAAGGGSTQECWQESIKSFLITDDDNVLNSAQTCIAQYAEDVNSQPPRNRYENSRSKRSSASSPIMQQDSVVVEYSECLSTAVTFETGRNRLNFQRLSAFVRSHTQDPCDSVPVTQNTQKPSWPFRFVALSKPGSELRSPLDRCGVDFFPPDPYWSTWGAWSECPKKCGMHQQMRKRTCRDGQNPSRLSNACPGESTEARDCPSQAEYCTTPQPQKDCSQTVVYTPWTDWSSCWNNCTQTRWRQQDCESRYGHKSGEQWQARSCRGGRCPSPNEQHSYGWGKWVSGPCSKTCGWGKRQQVRLCLFNGRSPVPNSLCPGGENFNRQLIACINDRCRVVYGWGPWSAFTRCRPRSGHCGHGVKRRTRKCLQFTNSSREVPSTKCHGSNVITISCTVPCHPQ
ncbi:uncharacterized protein LOC143451786 isoform X1 [Clavelina lepadiformis]|uniref:uncharacterized protein LOC143451786 isoform X1 n=1 Tax=Clavelina lepadiformis TaxID=159417 RepID=UPI004040F6DB